MFFTGLEKHIKSIQRTFSTGLGDHFWQPKLVLGGTSFIQGGDQFWWPKLVWGGGGIFGRNKPHKNTGEKGNKGGGPPIVCID